MRFRFEPVVTRWPAGHVAPTSYQALEARFQAIRDLDRLQSPIYYDLGTQLRASGVTIRQLAGHMDITLARVREIIADPFRVPYMSAWCCQRAIEEIARGRRS